MWDDANAEKGKEEEEEELRLQNYPSTFKREEILKTEVFWSAKRVTALSFSPIFLFFNFRVKDQFKPKPKSKPKRVTV
jgi:hypothetical protein